MLSCQQKVYQKIVGYVFGNEEAAAFWSALGFTQRIVTAGVTREDLERKLR